MLVYPLCRWWNGWFYAERNYIPVISTESIGLHKLKRLLKTAKIWTYLSGHVWPQKHKKTGLISSMCLEAQNKSNGETIKQP